MLEFVLSLNVTQLFSDSGSHVNWAVSGYQTTFHSPLGPNETCTVNENQASCFTLCPHEVCNGK